MHQFKQEQHGQRPASDIQIGGRGAAGGRGGREKLLATYYLRNAATSYWRVQHTGRDRHYPTHVT